MKPIIYAMLGLMLTCNVSTAQPIAQHLIDQTMREKQIEMNKLVDILIRHRIPKQERSVIGTLLGTVEALGYADGYNHAIARRACQ